MSKNKNFGKTLAIIIFVSACLTILYFKFQTSESTHVKSKTKTAPSVSPEELKTQILLKNFMDNPDNPETILPLANHFFDTGKHVEAISYYKKYLDIIPANPNVWTDLGVMYRRNKQPLEAIQSFDMAISLDPSHQQSRFNKGVVLYYDLQNKEAGKEAWQELVNIHPEAKVPDGRLLKDVINQLE